MKVGIDSHVARAARQRLVALGHEVVVVAAESEADAAWFARALAAGAEAVVSADSDLRPLAREACVYWIRVVGSAAAQVADLELTLTRIAAGIEPLCPEPQPRRPKRRKLLRLPLQEGPFTPLVWTVPGTDEDREAIVRADAQRRQPRRYR